MSTTLAPQTEKQSRPLAQTETEILGIDLHTFKDLEIFESESGICLFQFCNLSRTKGGEKVLRRRMERPWSKADHIQKTQESLSFIIDRRQAFANLPSGYVTSRIEDYAHDALPVVDQENLLEFSVGAFALWANHDRHYSSIVRGVQFTCRLIRVLRSFVAQPEMALPTGELASLVEETRALLARPRMAKIPDHEMGGWGAWKILRLDQLFRVYEEATIAHLLRLTYEIDALIAMADANKKYRFVLPSIEVGLLKVRAEGLVHPYVSNAVANPVEMDQDRRVLFLTGPNMAGKTTYLRAFATALYLAHLGMGVPARSFSFAPAQRLFSSISLKDNLRSGISYFRAEALRVKAIAQAVAQGYRVVALMDEPFKGTNVKDAFDASLAVLSRFAVRDNCLLMFSSHQIELEEQLRDSGGRIDCRYFEAEEAEGRLRFDYLLRTGISSQRLGMRVLREEGVFELLDETY